jgi:predicted kinase
MAELNAPIVVLLGFPGTGKLTIARKLAPILGAIVIDNHWINNPIFGVIESDGKKPLPESVWARTSEVRAAVLETIGTLSRPERTFILTYSGMKAEAYDIESLRLMQKAARDRESAFIPIRLLCSEDELRRRVVNEDRRRNMKMVNPDMLEKYRDKAVLDTGHSNQMTLDVSALSADESAARIAAHVGRLARN